MNLTAIIILLAGMVICAVVSIMLGNLIKAGISVAVTSALLSIVMFLLKAPLAAAFELSVCAGLIPAIFISTISMTKIRSKEEIDELKMKRKKKLFLFPLFLAVLAAAMLFFMWDHIDFSLKYDLFKEAASTADKVRDIFWNKRQVDLIGLMIIILAGVFGVIIFFKESDEE